MKKGIFLIVGLLAISLWPNLGHGQAVLTLRRSDVPRDQASSTFTAKVGDTFSLEVYVEPQGEAITGVNILLTVDDYFDIIPQGGGVPFRTGQIGGTVAPNGYMAGDGAGNPNGNTTPGYQLIYTENLNRSLSGTQPTVSTPVTVATLQLRAARRPRTGLARISVDIIRGDGGTGYYITGQPGSRRPFNPITNASVTVLGFTILPVPDVRLLPGGSDTLNLNNYVEAASVTWTNTHPDSIDAQIDPQTSLLALRALPGFVGRRDIIITATDPGGDAVTDTFSVTVSSPPVILRGSFPDTIRFAEDTVDTTLSLTGKARDPDSSRVSLTWTASQGKAVAARVDAARGNRLILTPNKDFNGTDRFLLTVSNQYDLKDTTSVVAVVTPVNDPPVFFQAFPRLTIPSDGRDSSIVLTDYVRDVDNSLNDPGYLFAAATTDSILASVKGLRVFVTPVSGSSGDKRITVTAVDPDGARSSQVLTVTVTAPTGPPPPPAQSPVVTPPAPDKIGMVSGGAQVALPLDPLVTDPDTPDNQIRWTVKGNTDIQVNIDSGGGQNRAILQAPGTFIGFELLTFTATDPGNLSGSFQVLAFSVQPSIPDVGGLPDTAVVAGGRTPYVDFDDYIFDSNDPDSALVITPVVPADLRVVIDPATHRASVEALDSATPGVKQVVFEVRNRANQRGLDTVSVRVDPAGQVRLSDFPQVTFRADQTATLRLDDHVLSGGASRLVWTTQFNGTRLGVTIDANRVATFRSIGEFTGEDLVTLTARDPLTNSQSVGTIRVTVQAAPVTIRLKALPNITFASGATDRSLRLNNYVETVTDTSRLTWQARLLSGKTNTVTVFIDPTTRFVTFGSLSGFTGQETVLFTARAGTDSATTSTLVTVVPSGSTAGVLRIVTIANPVQRAFVDVFVYSKQELASEPTVIVELNSVRSLIPVKKVTASGVGDVWNGNLTLQIGQAGSGRILASAVSKQQIALTDTARFTVGTVNPGFALTVTTPGVSLTMPPGAFQGAALVALVQSRDGDVGGAAKPVAAGLIPASEAYSVILSETPARAGEIRFDLSGVDGAFAGQAGVYLKDGDAWRLVGSEMSAGFVSAPVLQGGVYRVMIARDIGDGTGSGPRPGEGAGIPKAYDLSQNYPNPFNPATSIRLSIPEAGPVHLRVYDLAGRLVRTLVSGVTPAGSLVVTWDGMDETGRRVASGVYLYRLESPTVAVTKKMMLLK